MWNNIDEVRRNYKELRRIIHQQEKKIQFLETKALHLSMLYVASQLLIFLSNSKPFCRKSWKPLFFLSLSIAVAFMLNFTTTVVKYVRTKYEQDRNYIDQEHNFHQMVKLERLGAEHGSTCLKTDMQQQQYETGLDMFVSYQRYAHIGITAAALFAITALVLHACRSSVCVHTI